MTKNRPNPYRSIPSMRHHIISKPSHPEERISIIDAQRQGSNFLCSRQGFFRRLLGRVAALLGLLAIISCTSFEASLIMPGTQEVLGSVQERNHIFASRQKTDWSLSYSELDEKTNILREIRIQRGTVQDGDDQQRLLELLTRVAAHKP